MFWILRLIRIELCCLILLATLCALVEGAAIPAYGYLFWEGSGLLEAGGFDEDQANHYFVWFLCLGLACGTSQGLGVSISPF